MERVFKFPNALNNEQHRNLVPDAGRNTTTIETQIQYVDDPRNIRPGADPVTLPAEYGMDINLLAVDSSTPASMEMDVRAFVTVDPLPGEN